MTDRCAGSHVTGVCLAVLTATTLSAVALVSAGWMWKRREPRRRLNESVDLHEIALECEAASATTLELVARNAGQCRDVGWRRMLAEFAALEQRIGDAANAARDERARRSLDHLGGVLISLRGALEADMRLHLDATTPATLLEAGDDVLLVRCEDLVLSARALGDVRV